VSWLLSRPLPVAPKRGFTSTEKLEAEIRCASAKSVYFRNVKATLTQLRRDTSKVVRPVIHGKERLTLTEHGQPCAEIIPLRKIDRRAACQDLIALGPVEFLPRK
jgi:prevent-host-death family protein